MDAEGKRFQAEGTAWAVGWRHDGCGVRVMGRLAFQAEPGER